MLSGYSGKYTLVNIVLIALYQIRLGALRAVLISQTQGNFQPYVGWCILSVSQSQIKRNLELYYNCSVLYKKVLAII